MVKRLPPVPLFEVAVVLTSGRDSAEIISPEAASEMHFTFARTRPWALCGRQIAEHDPGRQLSYPADLNRAASCPICLAMLDQWLIKGVTFCS